MKNMKKLWAALLALAMTFSLAACGGTSDEDAATDDQPTGEEVSGDTAPESDVAYIQDKGTLVVGITYFAPMDYKEEGSDEWIGFDADMAKAFAESEFEKYRVIQDRQYQSDFDRLVASTEDKD